MKLLEEPPLKETRSRSAQVTPFVDPLPRMVELFRLLADQTRLRILRFLVEAEEYNVRALCDKLGQSQPAVSHHLALLHAAGLIHRRRQGKHNFYSLSPAKFEEFLDVVFAGKPPAERRVRVGKYVLSCEE